MFFWPFVCRLQVERKDEREKRGGGMEEENKREVFLLIRV